MGTVLSSSPSLFVIPWCSGFCCCHFSMNTLATWCEELTHLKRPWYWERLKAGGEGDDRGWNGWMASPTQWRWVCVSSRSWWWTGRPGVLQSMGLWRVRHDWATELTDWLICSWKAHPTTRGNLLCLGNELSLRVEWTSMGLPDAGLRMVLQPLGQPLFSLTPWLTITVCPIQLPISNSLCCLP